MYMKFQHKVSKGSRFNQIYIPGSMQQYFQAGDLVEVRLIEKSGSLFYSKTLKGLNEFRGKLIKEIFSSLGEFDIKQAFVVGSFLTKRVDYNDIDLLIISDSANEGKIFGFLTEKFNLKFQILVIRAENFSRLLEICPLTRSMLYYFISNKEFTGLPKRTVDKDHINFLLMMPQDLLEIVVGSRVFYDNIRRLFAIIYFLNGVAEDPSQIDHEIKGLIGEKLFDVIRKNDPIRGKDVLLIRKIIRERVRSIKDKIK